MISSRSRAACAVLVGALAVLPAGGCASAVRHPAITAGIVGGALGFATCKLASDNYGACALTAGGAGAFLALVAAGAIWLGGDGHSVLVQEQARPIPDDPDDGSPRRRRPAAPVPQEQVAPEPVSPVSPEPEPASPAPPPVSSPLSPPVSPPPSPPPSSP